MAKPSDSMGLLLLGEPAEGEEATASEAGPVEEDDAGQLAAEGLLKAIKRNDAGAVSRALKEHYEACKGRDYEGNGEGLDED